MKTVQKPEEIMQNARLFLDYVQPTSFLLVPDPRTMTPEQLNVATANSAAFDYWLSRNKNTEQGIDYSIQSIKECYKALRDAGMIDFSFGTAPILHKKSHTFTDDRGRVVRDLRREKQEQAQRDADEAAQPRKTLAGEIDRLERVAETNRMIENARDTINSWRGKYHSDTFRFREEATKVLNEAIESDRTIGGIASAMSKIKALSHKHYRE